MAFKSELYAISCLAQQSLMGIPDTSQGFEATQPANEMNVTDLLVSTASCQSTIKIGSAGFMSKIEYTF